MTTIPVVNAQAVSYILPSEASADSAPEQHREWNSRWCETCLSVGLAFG